MNIIFKITKNELRNLFYSPVAWFLLIVFLVQCAIVFTGLLYPIAHAQDIYRESDPNFRNWGELNSFTRILFVQPGALFSHILRNLYLFVPLLTMGLVSREINNGTIKLLYSSPVTIRQIVLGKYLAVVAYNLLLLCTLGIFITTAALTVNTIEYGLLMSATLGFFLLICAYSAIGLFMSSLTTYQIVSAISTFTIILLLSYIGGLWQQYDFIRDLTWFLSLVGRTDKMLVGLITTKDVIYFLVVIFMFVSFTLIRLKSGRASKPWYARASEYLTVLAIALTVGYISSRPRFTGYLDTTPNQINTIHPRIQKIIKELGDEPLEVTLYTNLMDDAAARGFPEQRNVYLDYLWEKYVRFKPDIKFTFKYYYDYDEKIQGPSLFRRFPNKTLKEIAERLADMYGVDVSDFMPPEEMKKLLDLRPENLRTIMQLKYKGQTEFLRTFPDTEFWPDETNVSAVFKRLLQAKIPKVVYITGNLERSVYKSGEREYETMTSDKRNRTSLINAGFDIDTVSLEHQDIPADASIVVLADPKRDLSPVVVEKIRTYINNGGNMFLLGEPKKQYVLNPVLQTLGVQLLPGTIVQPSENEMPHMATPILSEAGVNLSDENMLWAVRKLRDQKKADPSLELFGRDTITVLMPGVAGISHTPDSGFTMQPLALTLESQGWLKMGPLVTDSAAPVFTPAEGDIKGNFPTAIQLTRKLSGKEQRIVVCGDADFASNLRKYVSFFTTSAYSWLDENRFPIYTPRSGFADNLLVIGGKGAAALKIVYVWVIPGILLLFAIILLIRRKRK